MSFSYMQPSSAPMQNGSQQKASPYPQYGQPQQASPFSAPDMSVYSGPRTPPKGARVNDLSGQVPSNQIWAQAYNQASNQYGGNTQAQSWTMPGSFTSQGYNPATGQYSQPTGGQSWDGNMAYNAIDQRPGPIQATATGVNGSPMQWQDTMRQREAFVGNLSERLNQYSGGQLTGPVTFDQNQLLSRADEQLSQGTFSNPFAQAAVSQRAPQSQQAAGNFSQPVTYGDSTFQGYGAGSQQNPQVQKAMSNSAPYMTGTQWQNPFGAQANTPSFGPLAPPTAEPIGLAQSAVGQARPIPPPAQGTAYGSAEPADPPALSPQAEARARVRLLNQWNNSSAKRGGQRMARPFQVRGVGRPAQQYVEEGLQALRRSPPAEQEPPAAPRKRRYSYR